jgi:hypothetical protein
LTGRRDGPLRAAVSFAHRLEVRRCDRQHSNSRSASLKLNDQSHRLIVEHFNIAVLAHTHRNAEELAPIGHEPLKGEGIAFIGLTRAHEAHILG